MFSLSSVSPTSPHRTSYGCGHYPAGRVGGGRCSSPQLLVNIINNRSPFPSLHRCCLLLLLLPVALKPWTRGGLRLPPIDGGEGERGERQRWSGGSALSPHDDRTRKPALMTITSRVWGAYNHTGVFKNTERFPQKPADVVCEIWE